MTDTCHKQFKAWRTAKMWTEGKDAAGKAPNTIPNPPVAIHKHPVATKIPGHTTNIMGCTTLTGPGRSNEEMPEQK